MNIARVIVLCPLEIERRALAAAIARARLAHVEVRRTGPGTRATETAVAASIDSAPNLLLLAGLAGGLTELADRVPSIARIVDRDGRAWPCPWVAAPERAVTLLGVDAPILTPEDKRRLHHETGASLVDMESHAFALACDRAARPGFAWGVMRAISDGPDDELPPGVATWVDDAGHTRTAHVAASLVRRPTQIPGVVRLGRRSSAALRLLADRVTRSISRYGVEAGS